MKTGHNLIRERRMEQAIYKKLWDIRATPKIIIFVWLCFRKKILTMDNLQKRGFILANRCQLYKKDYESIDHLFFGCPYVLSLWGTLLRSFKTSWVLPNEVRNLMEQWQCPFRSSILRRAWDLSMAHLLWNVQKEINRKSFEGVERNVHTIWGSVQAGAKENISLIKLKKGESSKEEEMVALSWGLSWDPRSKKEDKRSQVYWKPPRRLA